MRRRLQQELLIRQRCDAAAQLFIVTAPVLIDHI